MRKIGHGKKIWYTNILSGKQIYQKTNAKNGPVEKLNLGLLNTSERQQFKMIYKF
jgi:hypothetical protein